MARFGVLIFALALLPSSVDGWARDKNGTTAANPVGITWMRIQGLR